MTPINQSHLIEEIEANAKPNGELNKALAQISSNGKPSPLFQSNRAMLLDRTMQNPQKQPQPHK